MGEGIRTLKNVLVVADEPGWAFDHIYKGLKKNITDYIIDVFYLNAQNNIQHNVFYYDVVLYLCDNFPLPLIQWINSGLSKEKVVLAVRSEVNHPLYDRPELLDQCCQVLAVSNDKLFDRFKNVHPNVKLAPGGVDTDVFTYKDRKCNETPIVGWSGSVGVFDAKFRGLDIIGRACEELGWLFHPALRQIKHRNEQEMVDYYHNEIDIYVEMSKSAGRQNGMIEAAACGLPVISYNCGIAEDFICNNTNGILINERNVDKLKQALITVKDNYEYFANQAYRQSTDQWSWEAQSRYFEEIFKII